MREASILPFCRPEKPDQLPYCGRPLSCASERAQKEEAETKEAARQLTAAYYSCVRASFASQVKILRRIEIGKRPRLALPHQARRGACPCGG